MDDLPDALEQFAARVETLERRVKALEALEHPAAAVSAAPELAARSADEVAGAFSVAQAAGAFSVLGKAMLGIAGAYLLRAVAESGSLPLLTIAAVAIVYALLWLVAAARVKPEAWLHSLIYAGASALILAPMLWELTLKFKVLPPTVTAGILAGFVLVASALAWKRDLVPVFWVANAAAALTALALLLGTSELPPFLAALLLMALISEGAALRNHERSVRPLIAAAADLAVWVLIYSYLSPQNSPANYPAIARLGLLVPAFLLFLIYGSSVTIRALHLRRELTLFDASQALVAFLLAACSVVVFEPGGGGVLGLGLACLLLAAACYAAVLFRFDTSEERRNSRIFATWAAGLLLAGCVLSLPALWLAVCLSLAAIGFIVLGVRLGRLTLQFHGLAFLAMAAAQSGLLRFTFHALIGSLPAGFAWSMGVVATCAPICYLAARPCPQETWKQQFLHLVTAALAVCALAALLIQGLLWLAALGIAPDVQHIAFIRTLTLCAAALALAFGGSHWRRIELTRIAYAALGLVAVKLLYEDLRHGHLAFIAGSIFLFAVTLMAVPRLARTVQNAQELASARSESVRVSQR